MAKLILISAFIIAVGVLAWIKNNDEDDDDPLRKFYDSVYDKYE